MQSKHIVSVLAGAALVGGVAFYGGTIYAKSGSGGQSARTGDRTAMRAGLAGGGQFARAGGAGFTVGEVLSKDATSLTLKLRDGGSKTVYLSKDTKVGKMADGTLDDVAQGTEVTITGAANQDGSVTASSIQIRPAGETSGRVSSATPAAPAAQDPATREIVVASGNFKFEPSNITVKKGEKVRIRLKNAEGFHDWKIDEFNAATSRVNGEGETTVEFTADKAGQFEYYCSVGDHRAMGMKGTLTVEE